MSAIPTPPPVKPENTVKEPKEESHEEYVRRSRFWRSLGAKIRAGARIR